MPDDRALFEEVVRELEVDGRLTHREFDVVFERVVAGKRPAEIAATFGTSTNTVEAQLRSAYLKIRCYSTEAGYRAVFRAYVVREAQRAA